MVRTVTVAKWTKEPVDWGDSLANREMLRLRLKMKVIGIVRIVSAILILLSVTLLLVQVVHCESDRGVGFCYIIDNEPFISWENGKIEF